VCPLSPLLFLFVVESLSRATMEAKRSESITGVRIGRSLSLTHLLFVDDVLSFSNGSARKQEKCRKDWRSMV
jgi:hypothetical protein